MEAFTGLSRSTGCHLWFGVRHWFYNSRSEVRRSLPDVKPTGRVNC